jgi:hypothetical protein
VWSRPRPTCYEKLPRDERSLGRSRYFGGVNLNGDLMSSSMAFDEAPADRVAVVGDKAGHEGKEGVVPSATDVLAGVPGTRSAGANGN